MLTRFVTRDVDSWFAALAESPRLPGDVVTADHMFVSREVARQSGCETCFARFAFIRRFGSGVAQWILELEVPIDRHRREDRLMERAVVARLIDFSRSLSIAVVAALPQYLYVVAANAPAVGAEASPRTLDDAPPAEATPDVASAMPEVAPGAADPAPAAAPESALPLPEAVASERSALRKKYPWLKGRC